MATSALKQTLEPAAVRGEEKRAIFSGATDGRVTGFPPSRFTRSWRASDDEWTLVAMRLAGEALRRENLQKEITVAGIVAGNFQ